MLIKCPECSGTVSTTAKNCPHCGAPVAASSAAPVTPPTQATATTAPSKLHQRILEGNGTQENPFVLSGSEYITSAQAQVEILERLHGGRIWSQEVRKYHTSKRGEPNNADLLEYVVIIRDVPHTTWFDLYLVTKLNNDPGYQKAKEDLLRSPAGLAMEAEIRKILFQGATPQQRGCLLLLLLIGMPSVIVAIRLLIA